MIALTCISSKATRLYLALMLLTGVSTGGHGQMASPSQSEAVLSEGTLLTVYLAKDAYTTNVGQGDPIEFFVLDNIQSTDPSHALMIAKGAVAMGRVITRSKGFDGGISGKLTFTCEYALRVDGKKIWLRGSKTRSAVETTIQAKHSSVDIQLERSIMRRGIGYPLGTQFDVYVDQDSKMAFK